MEFQHSKKWESTSYNRNNMYLYTCRHYSGYKTGYMSRLSKSFNTSNNVAIYIATYRHYSGYKTAYTASRTNKARITTMTTYIPTGIIVAVRRGIHFNYLYQVITNLYQALHPLIPGMKNGLNNVSTIHFNVAAEKKSIRRSSSQPPRPPHTFQGPTGM